MNDFKLRCSVSLCVYTHVFIDVHNVQYINMFTYTCLYTTHSDIYVHLYTKSTIIGIQTFALCHKILNPKHGKFGINRNIH